MEFKTILVALDAAPQARMRLEIAASLAARHEAHLIGLHATFSVSVPPQLGYFERFHAPLFEPIYHKLAEKMRADAELSRQNFEMVVERVGLSAEWRCVEGYPSDLVALHGRYVDLIVLGQPGLDDVEVGFFRPFPEEVALAVGCPVLVIPYAGNWIEIGRRVVVGWDASREATRAVNDAMPLLADADSVTVLTVDPTSGPDGHGEIPGADIALHLARHGVSARAESTVSGGIDIGNVLLSKANDLAADLLVMGAYGHSRVRELLLGGATRTILDTMTLPVLMSH